MNSFYIFENEGLEQVRMIMIGGNPWFVGKDVCKYFGDTNYRRSLAHVDDCDKGVSQIKTKGGVQNMTIINESGFYSLIFDFQPTKANMNYEVIQQRLEKVKKFRRWVTHEVLPTIRKNGSYDFLPDFRKPAETVITQADVQEIKLLRNENINADIVIKGL